METGCGCIAMGDKSLGDKGKKGDDIRVKGVWTIKGSIGIDKKPGYQKLITTYTQSLAP